MKAIIVIEGKTFDKFPTIVQGDKAYKIIFNIKYNDDTAVDLTGDAAQFRMKSTGGGALKVNAACGLDAPATGVVSYTVGATDFDTSGNFEAEVQVTQGTVINTIKLGILTLVPKLT